MHRKSFLILYSHSHIKWVCWTISFCASSFLFSVLALLVLFFCHLVSFYVSSLSSKNGHSSIQQNHWFSKIDEKKIGHIPKNRKMLNNNIDKVSTYHQFYLSKIYLIFHFFVVVVIIMLCRVVFITIDLSITLDLKNEKQKFHKKAHPRNNVNRFKEFFFILL